MLKSVFGWRVPSGGQDQIFHLPVVRRSPGSVGLPGDAAGCRRRPHGDGRLVDDHPAAAVALHRTAAQRPAPRLTHPDAGKADISPKKDFRKPERRNFHRGFYVRD